MQYGRVDGGNGMAGLPQPAPAPATATPVGNRLRIRTVDGWWHSIGRITILWEQNRSNAVCTILL